MSQETEELPRSKWRDVLELLTREHKDDDVTIEVLVPEFGDLGEAERMPLAYIDYDYKDDALIVAVGGRNRRYPVVLRHMIEHPRTILMHPPRSDAPHTLEVEHSDNSRSLIKLHRRPVLTQE